MTINYMPLDIGIVIAITSGLTSLVNGLFLMIYKSKCNTVSCCCLSFQRDIEMEQIIDMEAIHYRNVKPCSVGSLVSYISKSSRKSKDNNISIDTTYTEFKDFFNQKKYDWKEFTPTLSGIETNLQNKSNSNSGSRKSSSEKTNSI